MVMMGHWNLRAKELNWSIETDNSLIAQTMDKELERAQECRLLCIAVR